ncbi:C-X-C chemokine receptor type 6 [Bombina bombina]|uniref:C-X-C chemokine receptor type 6 n=1 Tax=Bombina bombina TaxID=8345 RepID=UPI00235AB1A4|nr:C-X-C chemokine receptor type 6 [Bombina bombina]
MEDYSYSYDEETEQPVSHLRHTFLPAFYSIICIFGLSGNLLTIIIYIFYEKKKSLTDMFLMNLAMADMLFLCTLPFLAYQAARSWIFGIAMCKIIRGMYRINVYASMLTLTCITFDRLVSITCATKANKYQLNKHKWGPGICTTMWIISVLIAIPQFICKVDEEHCFELYDSYYMEVMMNSLQLSIGFFLPLVVMFFCYTLIVKTLINVSRFQKHKSLKIIIMVVLAFVITQIPYNVLLIALVSNKNYLHDKHFKMALIVTESIAYLHACLNPILYFFVGIKFRKNFWKILKDLRLAKPHIEGTENIRTTDGYSKNISNSNTEAVSIQL